MDVTALSRGLVPPDPTQPAAITSGVPRGDNITSYLVTYSTGGRAGGQLLVLTEPSLSIYTE